MQEDILSIFVDESGDFGAYHPSSPYYFVAMVLHEQSIDITRSIIALDKHLSNWGYTEHTIHSGPLIRREGVYKNELRENRKSLFNAIYHFVRLLDIHYICPMIDKRECQKQSKSGYTERLKKEILKQVMEHESYFRQFERIIVYYDNGQMELTEILKRVFYTMFVTVEFRKIEPRIYRLSQAADMICTLEVLSHKTIFTKSEQEFFHSRNAFKKNIYKQISKKKI